MLFWENFLRKLSIFENYKDENNICQKEPLKNQTCILKGSVTTVHVLYHIASIFEIKFEKKLMTLGDTGYSVPVKYIIFIHKGINGNLANIHQRVK